MPPPAAWHRDHQAGLHGGQLSDRAAGGAGPVELHDPDWAGDSVGRAVDGVRGVRGRRWKRLDLFGSAILVGLGNGLTVANATAGLMSVRPQLAGSAAGLSGAMTVALGAVLTLATGALVTAQNAPFVVLGMMCASSFAGLRSILYVRRVDLRDPLPDTI